MSAIRYFAYGSNLDADQLKHRCPSARGGVRARLADHRIDFTYLSARWTGGAADIIPHSHDEVWGVVYELDLPDLVRLDRFEAGYERVVREVEDDGGEPVRIITYSVRRKLNFPPSDVYLEKMLDWGARWELPAPYLERLRSVPTRRAPRRPR